MYPRWVFARSIVKDGNFSAEHLKMKKPANDVLLADGTGFMVTDKPYKEHLAVTKEIKEVQKFVFNLRAAGHTQILETHMQQSPGREPS